MKFEPKVVSEVEQNSNGKVRAGAATVKVKFGSIRKIGKVWGSVNPPFFYWIQQLLPVSTKGVVMT